MNQFWETKPATKSIDLLYCSKKLEKKKMDKKVEPKKDKKKICSALTFLTTTLVVAAVVYITIQEGKRIKVENELLSYEVW
jgi:hypothetical protein